MRPYRAELGAQPGPAGGELSGIRLLVDAPLPALGAAELEVLDGVGQIHLGAGDAGVDEGTVEEATGRTDERVSFPVFDVARLLADQNDPGIARSGAEDSLGGVGVKSASPAVGRRAT
jgi:hypothetical protein